MSFNNNNNSGWHTSKEGGQPDTCIRKPAKDAWKSDLQP